MVNHFVKLFLKTKNNFLKVITKMLKTIFYCFTPFSKQSFKNKPQLFPPNNYFTHFKNITKHIYIIFRFWKLLLENTTKHVWIFKNIIFKTWFLFLKIVLKNIILKTIPNTPLCFLFSFLFFLLISSPTMYVCMYVYIYIEKISNQCILI